jgi:hypothetical protein
MLAKTSITPEQNSDSRAVTIRPRHALLAHVAERQVGREFAWGSFARSLQVFIPRFSPSFLNAQQMVRKQRMIG